MYSRCNSQPYYNDITSMFTILCEALVLWGAFVTNVNAVSITFKDFPQTCGVVFG